jgi:hypothetical protein
MKYNIGDILIRKDGSKIKILNTLNQHNISFYVYEYCNFNCIEDKQYSSDEIEKYYQLDLKSQRRKKLKKLNETI